MPSVQPPFVSIALARLHRGVNACCWLLALALIVQLLVWCVATFMDVRRNTLDEPAAAVPLVVNAEHVRKPVPLISTSRSQLQGQNTPAEPQATEINRAWTWQDRALNRVCGLALIGGTLCVLALLPLIALGAVLATASATPGVERVVSSFMWAFVLGLFVLPMGHIIGLPWRDGALVSYQYMTDQVDLALGPENKDWGDATFYARFALMPLVCIACVGVVAVRFNSGVQAGMPAKEDIRLDPVLEKEAANIKASSLYGGRTAAALRSTVGHSMSASIPTVGASSATFSSPNGGATAVSVKPASSITQLSPGEAPKRLI